MNLMSSLAAVRAAVFILAGAMAWGDQIVMKNGDRITGEIVKKDGEKVTVQSKSFGLLIFQWADLETVQTDGPLNVALPGDQTVRARIQTQNGQIQVEGEGRPQTVPPGDVLALRNDAEQKAYERFLRPGLFDLWAISGGLALAGAKGNAATSTLTTPIQFVRATNTTRATAYFNSIRSSASIGNVSTQTARAVRGGWGYNRNLTTRVFANAFNDYEYDKFQSLDLRVVLGAGLGYGLWKGENGRLAVVGGGAWNREKFSPSGSADFTRNSAEAYWGDDFSYRLNARTNLLQSFRMFNNLSNSGEYRMNLDAGATTQLTKWLSWTVSVSDRYLTNPAPGRRRNDLLYATGLGFTYSR